jgi:hypothetical protein
MPKSKARNKTIYTPPRTGVRVRAAGPSHPLYLWVMLGLLLLGGAWTAVYYIAGDAIPFMSAIGDWNFLIGFALGLAGLLMSMRWR